MTNDAFGPDLEPIEDPHPTPASPPGRPHDMVRTVALVVIAIALAVSAVAAFRQMRHADRSACAQRVLYQENAAMTDRGRRSQTMADRIRACYE